MSVRGIDTKRVAESWFKQAQVSKDYFVRSLKSHREQMNAGGEYSGIHAQTYKLMVRHPWGQEYLKIESIE
jgi:hypothetical protein